MIKVPPQIAPLHEQGPDGLWVASVSISLTGEPEDAEYFKIRGGIPDETLAYEVAQSAIEGFKLGYDCFLSLLQHAKSYQ